ncbi:hypothetical protein LOZ65_005694 [Ophidiomyces ophidiicola]|nr:hypothetical protein LOZ65_005694 [Ophidiomyces ophidiicola]
MPAHNRKERRAAAASAAAPLDGFDSASIPLSRPSSHTFPSQKNAKTLLEIAAERNAATGSSQPELIHISSSGEILGTEKLPHADSSSSRPADRSVDAHDDIGDDDDAEIPPLPDTILLSFPLSVLYFTLSFLAAHQYAQETPLGKLSRDTIFIAFPTLTFIIHLAHGHIISFRSLRVLGRRAAAKKKALPGVATSATPLSMQSLFPLNAHNIIFCVIAILLGMRLIAMTNEGSYYAVMKRAPSIGTLWVWSVFELSPGSAVLGLLIPVVWAVGWKDYRLI